MSGPIRVLIQILTLNRSSERLPLFSRSIKVKNVAVNSHADEWGNSSLELDYRRLLTLESPALSAVNALYPRIKKLGDGTYLLLYQQGHRLGMSIML